MYITKQQCMENFIHIQEIVYLDNIKRGVCHYGVKLINDTVITISCSMQNLEDTTFGYQDTIFNLIDKSDNIIIYVDGNFCILECLN